MRCFWPKVPQPCASPVKIEAQAPAKVNLTLHVTGQRADGYHLLDSLVVFADVCDVLTATTATDTTLLVHGPFAAGVPLNDTNLIIRAAELLRARRGGHAGAALTLEKVLPHAAGIGSGSSDAAATLKMVAALWDVDPLEDTAPEVLALGADVPVCMRGPNPVRMRGIGEILDPVSPLPDCALVLIRPPVDVPTGAVFAGLTNKDGAPMDDMPEGLDFAAFAHWLHAQRNDLQSPALEIAPEVAATIKAFEALPQVAFAGMSGSGATCFALVQDLATAQAVADVMADTYPAWWIAPARIL
ncbi:4-(cytidine 5'-diphospho)-2-C-methyl-D-erythritol kinase [Yoonia sp.]|uniref:4-(cytidine 5'-diphospho)-2-C-methyl-D-erythritol kinase n=1 Tax=Yoonia sp. TaxID=2212373 RepID=UPI0035C82793